MLRREASELAILHGHEGVVTVLVTSGILESARFAAPLDRFAGDVEIVAQACPDLLELIERGEPTPRPHACRRGRAEAVGRADRWVSIETAPTARGERANARATMGMPGCRIQRFPTLDPVATASTRTMTAPSRRHVQDPPGGQHCDDRSPSWAARALPLGVDIGRRWQKNRVAVVTPTALRRPLTFCPGNRSSAAGWLTLRPVGDSTMASHRIGTREEWVAARAELLRREKEHTRVGDELARLRRELPWVPVDKQYTLQTERGPKTLRELFDGRSQLVVYHFMFGPDYDAGCPTCSSVADSFDGVLAHLEARDVTMICVSRAPIEKLLAYRERMGWSFDWASSHESDFNFDYGVSAREGTTHDPAAPLLEANELALLKLLSEQPDVRKSLPRIATQNASSSGTNLEGYFSEGHGVSTFTREGDAVYHCYSTYARGAEFLLGYYAILDRAPNGRDEGDQPMSWLRRHDEYDERQGSVAGGGNDLISRTYEGDRGQHA